MRRAADLLGLPVGAPELRELFLRMRHGVEEAKEGALQVLVPAYRNDILHERDLIEDAAIAYGYGNVPRTLVPSLTLGRPLEVERRTEQAAHVLTGLGLVEIMSLVLTSPEQSDRLLELPDHPDTVLIENPISVEQTQLRTSLLPGLLWTLARNRHHPLPQGIFEVGDVTFVDPSTETGARERRHLAFAVIAPRIGFAEIRALAEAVVREFGWALSLRPVALPFLLEGRGAGVLGPDAGPRVAAGIFGEVHPRILERLGLQNPAVVCEIALPGPGGAQPYLSVRE